MYDTENDLTNVIKEQVKSINEFLYYEIADAIYISGSDLDKICSDEDADSILKNIFDHYKLNGDDIVSALNHEVMLSDVNSMRDFFFDKLYENKHESINVVAQFVNKYVSLGRASVAIDLIIDDSYCGDYTPEQYANCFLSEGSIELITNNNVSRHVEALVYLLNDLVVYCDYDQESVSFLSKTLNNYINKNPEVLDDFDFYCDDGFFDLINDGNCESAFNASYENYSDDDF